MHRAQTALFSISRHSAALCAALIVALFLVGLRAPMRIGTDAAIQLIPFEQWARGASPTPFQLTTADPAAWHLSLWSRRGWRVAGLTIALAGSLSTTAFLVHDVQRAPPDSGQRYALPRGSETARPMLARVSREAANAGAIVAVSWNDFDMPLALSLPNRLYFPFDTVHMRMDPRTPIVLITQATGASAPPPHVVRSFDRDIQWVRRPEDTDVNVAVWHAVFPARGGTP